MVNNAEYQQLQRNINAAPRFVEPRVHPDIDSYLHSKLEQSMQAEEWKDTLRAQGRLVDDKYQLTYLAELKQKGENEKTERLQKLWGTDLNRIVITPEEAEIGRVQGLWSAAARGDFTSLRAEVAQDIKNIQTTIDAHRNSSDFTKDVELHDSCQSNIDEWQAGLKETPINLQNNRLGQQIQRTINDLIAQRDSTRMGTLNKELRTLQRVQKAITTF